MIAQFVRGPLGYSVVVNGKAIGRIKDARNHGGWLVSIQGWNAATDKSPFVRVDGEYRHARTSERFFTNLRDAKKAIRERLAARAE